MLLHGGIVFRGYWNNEEATAEALDADGWFHTGDLGELDDDGYLRITGRKKEIIVTAGGKNVAPAVLEDRIRAHRLVSQCMVVGDQRPFIAALITLDEEALPALAGAKGKPADQTAEQVREDAELLRRDPGGGRRRQQGGVQGRGDQEVPDPGTDFTEETGMLTPSLKLKRTVVMKEFADEIEALYAAGSDTGAQGSSRSAKVRGDRRPGPALLHPGPAGRAHRAGPGRVGEQAGDRGGDRVGRPRVDDVAGLAVPDRVRRAAGVPATTGSPLADASRKTMPRPSTSRPRRRVRHGMANTSPAA